MSVILIDALSARQGGGQTYLLNLLTRLPPGDPTAIYLLAPDDVGRQVASDRVRLLKPEWPVRNGLVRAVWERLYLRRHAARLGASLVFFPGGIVGSRAPRGARRVTMFRNVIPFDIEQRQRYPLGYQRLRNWVLERVMLKSMLNADLVIFLSSYGRSLIEKSAGRAIPRAVTIPHGVSPLFRSAAQTARPDWLPRDPYLLYVSSFEPYKAQLEVVHAFARVVQEWREPLSLVLVGPSNTAYAQLVREEIARLQLDDRVSIPGNRPYAELPAAHQHSLIGIFASEAENCPNALLEAMAAGKPILCSSRPPMPEFGGDAVLYFDPANVDELSAQLLRLLRGPETRAQLGARAAQWSRRFDWDETARATWSALQRLQKAPPRLIIHAPNVHIGGGRELLAALMEAIDGRHEYIALLDERFASRTPLRHAAGVMRVRPTLRDRLAAEWQLRSLATSGARVLCFGNLPPLFRLPAKVYLYLQNRYLLGDQSLADWPPQARTRLTLERWWLATRLGNADTIVVQTSTMRESVRARFGREAMVAPFLPERVAASAASNGPAAGARNAFLYVASGEPHKNHGRLLEAWRLLARDGLRPPLWLTLDSLRYAPLVALLDKAVAEAGLNISNFGNVSRGALRDLYGKAAALIYPSTLESYGLPLLEARAAGLPLLTGELDYVRDIVDPDETFDPYSPLSIARAVKRFLGRPEERLPAGDAERFLARLLADDAG
jgi:glycosyltransferase involved in cell wall biosynthesis